MQIKNINFINMITKVCYYLTITTFKLCYQKTYLKFLNICIKICYVILYNFFKICTTIFNKKNLITTYYHNYFIKNVYNYDKLKIFIEIFYKI